jgi:hypothetical protein
MASLMPMLTDPRPADPVARASHAGASGNATRAAAFRNTPE